MTITDQTLVAEVRRLAAENPNFVYQKPEGSIFCVYVEQDSDGNKVGSCILGQAMINLGVPAEKLVGSGGFAGLALDLLDMEISEKVRWWAVAVQGKQDKEIPWGRAVEIADEEEPLVAA
ncbi:hypothetical protein ACWCPQ_14405 [Nocardia sp. NPDC001965]